MRFRVKERAKEYEKGLDRSKNEDKPVLPEFF
jgi:hypothetical protein